VHQYLRARKLQKFASLLYVQRHKNAETDDPRGKNRPFAGLCAVFLPLEPDSDPKLQAYLQKLAAHVHPDRQQNAESSCSRSFRGINPLFPSTTKLHRQQNGRLT